MFLVHTFGLQHKKVAVAIDKFPEKRIESYPQSWILEHGKRTEGKELICSFRGLVLPRMKSCHMYSARVCVCVCVVTRNMQSMCHHVDFV